MKLNRKGYSLIEMMLAVAILGILVMVAVPDLLVWSANHRLRSNISELQGNLQVARITAINRNAPVTLLLNSPAANQYTIFVDDGQGLGGVARDLIRNGTEEIIQRGSSTFFSLGDGVVFQTINAAGNAFLFNGRGLRGRPVTDPSNVIIQNSEGRSYQIFVTMTGDINGSYL